MVAERKFELEPDVDPADRSLLLVWQNPKTRHFARVGEFSRLESGNYRFRYVQEIRRLADFAPLDEYPHFDRDYVLRMSPPSSRTGSCRVAVIHIRSSCHGLAYRATESKSRWRY